MRFMQSTHRAIRVATVAVALALASPSAIAQQPSATAIATAKEIVTVTGATTLFNPLIAGVVEQAKILFLQQNPALSRISTRLPPKCAATWRRVSRNWSMT